MQNESIPVAGTKILIVDDTPANLDVLRKTLELEGYHISMARSGEIALQIAPNFKPDLILLDVMMPGLDGYETCQQLKANADTKNIPVIFITAKNDVNDIVQGFDVGGVDYISKPFKQKEVLARVQTQIKLRYLIQCVETKNKELTELDDLRKKFLGMAAHDLRTPLASIGGFSQLLIQGSAINSDADREDFLSRISKLSNHMLALINDLLDYSVIESGKLTIEKNKASLKDLTLDRIGVHEHIPENKKIKINSTLAELQDFEFDAERVTQVIDNLMSNAIKYSPPELNIYVTLDDHGEAAKFSVRDEGPGISPEDQKKMFNGFEKLKPRPTAGEKSTGLGLTIVKKMVEAHQGSLMVESKPGQGSTFSFTLPK